VDGQRFDDFAKLFAQRLSRRAALRTGGAALAGGLLGLAGQRAAAIACRSIGSTCDKDALCCSALCAKDRTGRRRCACPPGWADCGGACVDPSAYQADPTNCGGCGATCPRTRCQLAVCTGGTCGLAPDPAMVGRRCDDGNACTTGDTCQPDGTCAGTPITCAASDQCHDPGTCNPATGQCSNPVRANGAPCDDGDACTRTDTCQGGVCIGGNPNTCAASDQCHLPGSCDPATGECSNPAKPDGTACVADNDACTADTCQAGVCTAGPPKDCTADPDLNDQCTVGLCNPATGRCEQHPKPNGTACDDGNACTQTDTCQGGKCVGGNPVVCTASDPCRLAGTCDPATGHCSNPAKPDGAPCSDDNACTDTDTCQAGDCTPGTSVVCDPPGPCQEVGVCNHATGRCEYADKPNGMPCDDGNKCTNSICSDGVCVAGSAVSCDDNNACTTDTCDPQVGCIHTPIDCDDHDACTTDTCDPQTGLCVHTPVECDDHNSCTTDTCDARVGCVHTPIACPPPGQCQTGTGTCDPATGHCVYTSKPDGTGCDDGNPCTVDDTCQNGVCTGGTPVVCTPSDDCHLAGVCDPASGQCSNPAKPDGSDCGNSRTCCGGACCPHPGDGCAGGSCCTPQTKVATCAGRCGIFADTCGQSVDCGGCDAGQCLTCDAATRTCVSTCGAGQNCCGGSCKQATGSTCTTYDDCCFFNCVDGICGCSEEYWLCEEDADCCADQCLYCDPVLHMCAQVCPDFVPGCPDCGSLVCNPPQTLCDLSCVDTSSHRLHCGQCGRECPRPTAGTGTSTCVGGVCGIACADGYHPCGGNCVSDDSPTLCGASCTDCTAYAPADTIPTCSGGSCAYRSCAGAECCGDADCDDGNPCTTDTCTADLRCLHTPLPPGASCGPNGQVCHNQSCCTPEATATTCTGRCGTVTTNNCGQSVDCGCDAGQCLTCDGSGNCVSACGPGQGCLFGMCCSHPGDACADDTECCAGFLGGCAAGACQCSLEFGLCTTKADCCSECLDCVDNFCQSNCPHPNFEVCCNGSCCIPDCYNKCGGADSGCCTLCNNNSGCPAGDLMVCYQQGCCLPYCVGQVCGGPDGCGGTCNGSCPSGQVCHNKSCCTPNCAGKCDGIQPDGCGGHCGGDCPSGQTCTLRGLCCTPRQCPECGNPPDGCGGTCPGGCAKGQVCAGGTCCTPNCAGKCWPRDDGCGNYCPDYCDCDGGVYSCNGGNCICL
jgi:hypothetical protein